MSFFAKPGEYPPCGMFSLTHIIVLILCIIIIILATYFSRNLGEKKITILTRIIAIILIFLETGKIIFSYFNEGGRLNSYLPLHFCSMFIYATILAGFTKGIFSRLGKSFIASGAILAGFSFLVMPTTSITSFPMWHFLSCYSMLFHSLMVYLGLTYLINKIVILDIKVLPYYAVFCTFFAGIAYIINAVSDTNLMFLKEPYNIPIAFLEPLSKNYPFVYSLLIYAVCTYVTFFFVFGIYKLVKHINFKKGVLIKNGKNNFN